MESTANTAMEMRRRLRMGPRSANGRVARLTVIFMGLRSRQGAGDPGDAHGPERRSGAEAGGWNHVNDRQFRIGDKAGKLFGSLNAGVADLPGPSDELVFVISGRDRDAALDFGDARIG